MKWKYVTNIFWLVFHSVPKINFNKERKVEYTNIPGPIKVCMKVFGYPHYQFTVLANHQLSLLNSD